MSDNVPTVKMGRPTLYTPELAREICTRIAGGETLPNICKDEGFPTRVTVYRWTVEHDDFCNAYHEARRGRSVWRADEMDELVESLKAGEIDAAPAKVIMDAYRWQAARENPTRYGDKVRTEITGKDGGPVEVASDPLEVARRVAAIMASADALPKELED